MSVRVEKAGNRILLACDRQVSLKSTIPGAYFRKDSTWSLPLEMETCKLLRERFGGRLEIGPMLWSWAKAENQSRKELGVLAASSDAELTLLPTLAPKLAEAMASRTYQRSGVAYIVKTRGRDGRRRTLLGDTVGLGKSAEALGACLESGEAGPYLIVCPKTAVNSTWKAEINRWLPGDEVVTIPDGRAVRDNILNNLEERANWRNLVPPGAKEQPSLDRTWVVLHPASIRTQTEWICALCGSPTHYTRKPTSQLDCGHPKDRTTKVFNDHTFPQLFNVSWGGVVIDESDQVLIMTTGTPTLARRGAELLAERVRPNGVRLAMSGTPFRSKPKQIWSTLNWLDPVRWGGKWRWLEKYWDVSQSGYGGSYVMGEFREDREEMFLAELADVFLRRTREEVRGDLPAKLYPGGPLDPADPESPVGIWLDMTPKQEKAYRQMEKMASANLDGGEVSAVGVLAEMTRLKQFAGSIGAVTPDGEYHARPEGNKYEWLVELMKALGFPDKPDTKLVVVSQFTDLLNAWRDGFQAEFKRGRAPIEIGMVTGDVSQARRDKYVAAFEDLDSGLDIILLNTIAGGSSITLDAADVMVLVDETWVDDEQQQAEGRIDNRNPERKIVPRSYYYLRSRGTVEEYIAVGNAEAKRQGKRILDGVKTQYRKYLGK